MTKGLVFLVALSQLTANAQAGKVTYPPADNSHPIRVIKNPDDLPFLKFSELEVLGNNPESYAPLKAKIDTLFNTVVINNSFSPADSKGAPEKNSCADGKLGLVTYNTFDSQAVTPVLNGLDDEKTFIAALSPNIQKSRRRLAEALEQRALVADAKVMMMQEMYIGGQASGYINSPKEVARRRKMNYAFVPDQVDIEPTVLAGLSKNEKKSYRGASGNAIFSKYPIQNVRILHLDPKYNWRTDEKNGADPAEKTRQTGGSLVSGLPSGFREMKEGNQTAIMADLKVPGVKPNGIVTVVNVHLEIKCTPKARAEQVKQLMAWVKQQEGTGKNPNPMVIAGDLNATGMDMSKTSLLRVAGDYVRDPNNLINVGCHFGPPVVGEAMLGVTALNYVRTFKNPAAVSIWGLAENDTAQMFTPFKGYRDPAGNGFSTAGNEKFMGHYVSTFKPGYLPKPFEAVDDWFFTKPTLQPKGSQVFVPTRGRSLVLDAFNRGKAEKIGGGRSYSDHDPRYMELPTSEEAARACQEQKKPITSLNSYQIFKSTHSGISH